MITIFNCLWIIITYGLSNMYCRGTIIYGFSVGHFFTPSIFDSMHFNSIGKNSHAHNYNVQLLIIYITSNTYYYIVHNIFITDVHRCMFVGLLIINISIIYAVLRGRRSTAVRRSPLLRLLLRVHAPTAGVWKTVAVNL